MSRIPGKQVYVQTAVSNFTPSSDNLEAHFEALDNLMDEDASPGSLAKRDDEADIPVLSSFAGSANSLTDSLPNKAASVGYVNRKVKRTEFVHLVDRSTTINSGSAYQRFYAIPEELQYRQLTKIELYVATPSSGGDTDIDVDVGSSTYTITIPNGDQGASYTLPTPKTLSAGTIVTFQFVSGTATYASGLIGLLTVEGDFYPGLIESCANYYDASFSYDTGSISNPVTSWNNALLGFTEDLGLANGSPSGLGTINGQEAVDFDGVDDFVRSNSGFMNDNAGSIFAVVNPDVVLGNKCILSSADNSVNNKFIEFGITAGKPFINYVNGGTDNKVEANYTVSTGVPILFEFSSTGSAYEIRVNGLVQTLAVTSGTNNGLYFNDISSKDNVVIGALVHTSTSHYFDGDIGSVLRLSSYPSESERIEITDYLLRKYSIL